MCRPSAQTFRRRRDVGEREGRSHGGVIGRRNPGLHSRSRGCCRRRREDSQDQEAALVDERRDHAKTVCDEVDLPTRRRFTFDAAPGKVDLRPCEATWGRTRYKNYQTVSTLVVHFASVCPRDSIILESVHIFAAQFVGCLLGMPLPQRRMTPCPCMSPTGSSSPASAQRFFITFVHL